MRLRNVPGSREAIAESEYTINEPELNKGKWKEIFGNDNPIRIEIGMGKGKFITTLAQQNPDINYIGIEKFSSVLIRAIEKMEELEITNLKFIRIFPIHGQKTDMQKEDLHQKNFSKDMTIY